MDVSDDEDDYYADAPETINIDDEEDVMFAGEVAGRRQAPLSMYICKLILLSCAKMKMIFEVFSFPSLLVTVKTIFHILVPSNASNQTEALESFATEFANR